MAYLGTDSSSVYFSLHQSLNSLGFKSHSAHWAGFSISMFRTSSALLLLPPQLLSPLAFWSFLPPTIFSYLSLSPSWWPAFDEEEEEMKWHWRYCVPRARYKSVGVEALLSEILEHVFWLKHLEHSEWSQNLSISYCHYETVGFEF